MLESENWRLLSEYLVRNFCQGQPARAVEEERKQRKQLECRVLSGSKPSTVTVEPPNNEHIGDKHFVHFSEVAPSSEV